MGREKIEIESSFNTKEQPSDREDFEIIREVLANKDSSNDINNVRNYMRNINSCPTYLNDIDLKRFNLDVLSRLGEILQQYKELLIKEYKEEMENIQ